MIHLRPLKLKGFEQIEKKFKEANAQVDFAIRALERSYQFIKNVPEEMQEAIVRRLEGNKP